MIGRVRGNRKAIHAGLKKGHLSFVLHGAPERGWDLVRMRSDGKRENWLLIKEDDGEAVRNGANSDFLRESSTSVKSRRSMEEIAGIKGSGRNEKSGGKTAGDLRWLMERYPEVQLATLADKPPEGTQWLHEVKFDGYRLLGFVSDGVSRLRTRNGKDWTGRFPALTEALENLKVKNAVLDLKRLLDADGKAVSGLAGCAGAGGFGREHRICL
jgi:bifunctional non-homologous end joining protein LigD